MATMQPDLHKYFKNKKNVFNTNKLNKVELNCKEPHTKLIVQRDEVVENNLSSSIVNVCTEIPSSHSEQKVSINENRKRKWDQIDDNEGKMRTDAIVIKKQLGKCSNIHELRERLVKLKKCEDKLNKFRKNTTTCKSPVKVASRLEQFKSIDIVVPLSPSKSPCKTPKKTVGTPKKEYCHERYAHVVTEETLPMSIKYNLIWETFRAVDTVVSLLHNRQEIISFSKLKPAVQEMLRKTFNKKNLGQMKSVFPLAYFFRQEKINPSYGDQQSNYQLTISANMKYKETVAKNLFGTPTDVAEKHAFRKMDSVVLVDRRRIFHEALMKILKMHHADFLKSLDPPIELDEKEMKNWHPNFPLEDISEPESSPLPEPPNSKSCTTAKELCAKASTLFNMNNRMKNALENVAKMTSEKKPAVPTSSVSGSSLLPVALKGISLSLIEKIRAREAANAIKEMTRSKEQTIQLEMHQRLPEIARIIRNFFIAEKKAALSWEMISAKVAASYRYGMAATDMDAHLDLLVKTVPDWCTIHKVRSGSFFKIDKNRELQSVIDVLQIATNKL